MIEVVVSRLGRDATSDSYVVILQEKDGDRLLPIWIGKSEAESIVMHMHNIKRARPLTHDLCKSLIVGLQGSLKAVHVTRVENNTYFAELHVTHDGQMVQVDARPSDSIAIALRVEAPIFVSDELLSEMQVEETTESFGDLKNASELSAEQLKEYLEKLRPEDFGKFNL